MESLELKNWWDASLATAFGLRWQSGAATALFGNPASSLFQSGVALRLPPQSKFPRSESAS
jgi:hypothetical protein